MIKPQQPNTGMQLEPGYDRKLWTWINSLELKLTDLQNSIMAQATLELGLPLGGGDNYTGYFKAIQTAANKIKIVDGIDEDATNCWEGILNEFDCTCTATELTITADAWIYALAVPVGADPWTGITVTIEQSSSKPLYEADKSKRLISRVKFTDPAITDFSNEKEEFNGILLKECT